MGMKSVVRRVRATVRRVPVVGFGLRYAKRLVFLPWNFHKLLAAWSDNPPAAAAHAAAWSAATATQQTVWSATQAVAHVAEGQTWLAAQHVVRTGQESAAGVSDAVWTAAGEVKGAVADQSQQLAGELRRLNETHATCYDRLHDAARTNAAELKAMAALIADLTARVEELSAKPSANGHLNGHTPTILRRVG